MFNITFQTISSINISSKLSALCIFDQLSPIAVQTCIHKKTCKLQWSDNDHRLRLQAMSTFLTLNEVNNSNTEMNIEINIARLFLRHN